MTSSPESSSTNPKEHGTEHSFLSVNNSSKPPTNKAKSTSTMNPFKALSDSANFPPFQQAFADHDDDEPCNTSDFRLSDLSIGALAALTEHQRYVAKYGLDNSLCGTQDQGHETQSQASPSEQQKNPLDAEWSRILDSSSLVTSAINLCETSALQHVGEGMIDSEVASRIHSIHEGSDYFESSRVWALETPERARNKRNFITARNMENESYEVGLAMGSPNSHGLPAQSLEVMSPQSFGVSPLFCDEEDGTPTGFKDEREQSVVSLSAINLSHISGADLGDGSEVVFDAGEIDPDFAADPKMRLFQEDETRPTTLLPSPIKPPTEASLPLQCPSSTSSAPFTSSKSSPAPMMYAHRYNATRSMFASKIARSYVPARSRDKDIYTRSSKSTITSTSRTPLAELGNKSTRPPLSNHQSSSKKDGKENNADSEPQLQFTSPVKKIEIAQNTTALSTPPLLTPHSDALTASADRLDKDIEMNQKEPCMASPRDSERLRYRSVVPIRVFVDDEDMSTMPCCSNVDDGWYVQYDSLSTPLGPSEQESYSRMYEVAARKGCV